MTGSLPFGSSDILGRCCLWQAGLPFRWIGSAEVPLGHHILPAISGNTSHEVDTPFHSHLCPVHPGEGEMDFLPPCFKLFLTFCCYSYGFLRELDLAFGRSSDRVESYYFHGIRWAKLNNFAPDSQDVREIWVVRPHVILVKVIYVCVLHVFFHQYVADVQERKSENIFRTVSTSPLVFNLPVMRTTGAIVTPPLTTVVGIIDDVSTVTLFVVPPPPDIERPMMQAQELSNCRLTKSRLSSLLISLSASSSALTLPRRPAKFSSSSFSLDRFQPLRGKTSPSTGEALLPPPADDCLILCLDDPNTAVRCETLAGSEYPSSLPACPTVRAVLSAGPSDASDWVSTTLPEGSSTSAAPVTPGEDGSLPSEVPSCLYRYSESGDLLCSHGNPA